MGTSRSHDVTTTQGTSSSSNLVPDEASPLLHPESSKDHTHNTSRLSWSAFLDNNGGLLLVAASQLFFSAMGLTVKWLNTLDKPIPILEVCVSPRTIILEIV